MSTVPMQLRKQIVGEKILRQVIICNVSNEKNNEKGMPRRIQ